MHSMAAASVVVGILVVGAATVDMEAPLRALGEVVSGPARGRPLALHVDAALLPNVLQAVMSVEALRNTPHITSTISHNTAWQRDVVAREVFPCASSHPLHVLLWHTPQPELLDLLCRRWQPRNLLLVTLGQLPGTAVLRHEALGGVERLALIGRLAGGGDALGVYTAMPFTRGGGGVRLLGMWRSATFARWGQLFPDRFPSFEGYTFQLATDIRDPPFLYSTAAAPGVIKGVSVRILAAMAPKLNFSYTLTRWAPDYQWGIIENGSWVGVLGMVDRREKNFTVNNFFLTQERVSSFDWSEPNGEDMCSTFLPIPQPLPGWLSLVRPFTLAAWLSLLLVVTFVLILIAAMEKRTTGRSGSPCVWQGLPRAMVAQTMPAVPGALWQRLFLAIWLLGCLVVTTAYTCDLVRVFTRVAYGSRLHTLQELADSHYRCIAFADQICIMGRAGTLHDLFFLQLV